MSGMTALNHIGTPQQRAQLERFLELVRQANLHINLVSRRDSAHLAEHHLAPSCLFYVSGRVRAHEYILDIGSGGGFPGLVCAILQPDSQFVLVDSTRKKTEFLKATVRELGLRHVQIVWQRVETMAGELHWQQAFDRTISRAVAPLADIIQWSQPLLKPTGTIEALKGKTAALAEAQVLDYPVTYHSAPSDWQWNDHLRTVTIATVLPKPR